MFLIFNRKVNNNKHIFPYYLLFAMRSLLLYNNTGCCNIVLCLWYMIFIKKLFIEFCISVKKICFFNNRVLQIITESELITKLKLDNFTFLFHFYVFKNLYTPHTKFKLVKCCNYSHY